MLNLLIEFFERDLLKISEELKLYKVEQNIWRQGIGISNSSGNLALHLFGNLHHFIGNVLGESGYIRNRDLEFSHSPVSLEELLQKLDSTIAMVKQVLANLSEENLNSDYPLEKHGKNVSTAHMLLHLWGHLNYHLGQINYHRRLLDN